MAMDMRRRKAFTKKYKALNTRIKALIEKGEPFHREMAELHTLIAMTRIREDLGKRPQDLQWFLDAVSEHTAAEVPQSRRLSYPGGQPPASLDPYEFALDLGSRLVGGADTFSHVKKRGAGRCRQLGSAHRRPDDGLFAH